MNKIDKLIDEEPRNVLNMGPDRSNGQDGAPEQITITGPTTIYIDGASDGVQLPIKVIDGTIIDKAGHKRPYNEVHQSHQSHYSQSSNKHTHHGDSWLLEDLEDAEEMYEDLMDEDMYLF